MRGEDLPPEMRGVVDATPEQAADAVVSLAIAAYVGMEEQTDPLTPGSLTRIARAAGAAEDAGMVAARLQHLRRQRDELRVDLRRNAAWMEGPGRIVNRAPARDFGPLAWVRWVWELAARVWPEEFPPRLLGLAHELTGDPFTPFIMPVDESLATPDDPRPRLLCRWGEWCGDEAFLSGEPSHRCSTQERLADGLWVLCSPGVWTWEGLGVPGRPEQVVLPSHGGGAVGPGFSPGPRPSRLPRKADSYPITREEITALYRECMAEVARYTPSEQYDAYSLGWKVACAEKIVPLPAGRALVAGAKFGTEAVFLSRLGWEVVALDIDDRTPREVQLEWRFPLLRADLDDPRLFEIDVGPCDLVLFSETLEHLAFAPAGPLRWLRRHLVEGGTLVLVTPDAAEYAPPPADLPTRRECHWREIPEFAPGVARDISEHSKQYTEEELRDLLAATGFCVVSVEHFVAQAARLLVVAQ